MTVKQAEATSFGEQAIELAGLAAMLLGWRPVEFWESTPSELGAALRLGRSGDDSIDRAQIERLQALFPDD